MSRPNRRRRDDTGLDLDRALGGVERRETHNDGEWFVRRVSGAGSNRSFRCPGCQQEVAPGIPHIVAWPADGMGGLDDRRHWHTPCWTARGRRTPLGSAR
ncbi:MAG TPA: hypothetical protein VFF32_14985 [Dermatophilaceae bacterium]|nr:hypothetical protein [Dermatophilaceae bacterium]